MTDRSIDLMVSRLDQMVESFKKDPPDSDYQKGYLAAVLAIRQEAVMLLVSA